MISQQEENNHIPKLHTDINSYFSNVTGYPKASTYHKPFSFPDHFHIDSREQTSNHAEPSILCFCQHPTLTLLLHTLKYHHHHLSIRLDKQRHCLLAPTPYSSSNGTPNGKKSTRRLTHADNHKPLHSASLFLGVGGGEGLLPLHSPKKQNHSFLIQTAQGQKLNKKDALAPRFSLAPARIDTERKLVDKSRPQARLPV